MKDLPAIRHEVLYGRRVVRCFADRPASLDAGFRATVTQHGNRVAVVDEDRRLTYTELDAEVQELAAGLLALGYRKGERIALLIGNRLEFITLFLAAARIGLISVPLNTRQRRPEIEFVLNQNGSSAVIAEAEFAENLPEQARVPSLRGIYILDGDEGLGPLRDAAHTDVDWPEVDEEDTLCLLYTSGTTGKPKGAMLTHVSVIHSMIHFEWGMDLRAGDVGFLAVPASHVTGLVAIILAMIHVGGTTVMMRAFKARKFLELAEAERITTTVMVPAMYNLCLLEPAFADFDLSSWRVAGFGGAPMPPATIEKLARHVPSLVLQNAYGSTETSSPATLLPAGTISEHPESVGQPLPLADIVIVDDHGREVPPGESGELLIGGPMVVPGYWDNPEGDAKGFTGGYWVSGDVGIMDEDGFVRIIDRKKDMINRAGFKIYSIEVENVLAHHPHVVEAAVVGSPDEVLGERVHAFVYGNGHELSADEIKSFCAERLSDYKVPDLVTFLTEPLARNANGKVLKTELRSPA